MKKNKALMRIERQSMALAEKFLAIKVADNDSCEIAGSALNQVMAMEQAWDEHTKPNISRWHDGWKAALDERKRVADQLTRAERWLKDQIGAWKLRLKNEEARRQLEAEAAEKDRTKEVKTLKQAGEHREARQLLHRPITIAPVVARVEQPVLHKITVAEKWDYEIFDEAALPTAYTMRVPDLRKIRQTVEAMAGETRIPGVRVFAKALVAAGASEMD
jgi:hypothetical protein